MAEVEAKTETMAKTKAKLGGVGWSVLGVTDCQRGGVEEGPRALRTPDIHARRGARFSGGWS